MTAKIIHEGKYLRFLDRNGWEFVERINCQGIVMILALTEDQKVVLVEQYRSPVDQKVIEYPAGLVNDLTAYPDEDHLEAAKRELLEETGYEASQIKLLITGPVNTGMSADTLYFYYATELKKTGPGGGDATENITVHEIPLSDIHPWLSEVESQGKLIDPKVYAGLYFLSREMSL